MPRLKRKEPQTWMRGLGAYDGLLCALQAAHRIGRGAEFWEAYRRHRARLSVERATAFAADEISVTPSRPIALKAESIFLSPAHRQPAGQPRRPTR